MPVRPDQRWYASGAFEAMGLLGQLLVAAPNVGLLPSAADGWLRVSGILLATLYVCVLLMRMFLSDAALEASLYPPQLAEPATEPARSAIGSSAGWVGRSASGSLAKSPTGVTVVSPAGPGAGSPVGVTSPAGPQARSPVGPTSPAGGGPGPGGSPIGGDGPGRLAMLQVRLRAGDWRVVVPVVLVVILLAGFSLFGSRLLGLSDSVAPTAPSNVRAIGATAQQVDLTWDPVSDSSGVKEYRIVRADNGRERIAVTNRFYDTMDVTAGVTYAYTVLAVDGAGNVSPPSEPVTVQTPVFDSAACAIDSTAPTQPSNLRATVVTATAITLEWDPATDAGGCGLAGYHLLRDGQDTGISVAGTTVTEDGLEPNQSYVYSIVARDNASNDSVASAGLDVATLARPVLTQNPCEMSAPRDLHGTAKSDTTVSIAWGPPAEDCDDLQHYLIYRGATVVGQTAGTSFTVSNLMPLTTYFFRVRAYGSDEETSPSSNGYSVKTDAPPDTTPPTVPTNLVVTNRTPTAVHVAWAASTDAGGSGLKEYRVFLDDVLVGPTTGLGYTLPPMSPSAPHKVDVRAVDYAGNASAKATKNFTTAPPRSPDVYDPSPVVFGVDFLVKGRYADYPGTVKIMIESTLVASIPSASDGSFEVAIDVDDTGLVTGTTLVLAQGMTYIITASTPGCACDNDTSAPRGFTVAAPSPPP